LSVFYFIEKGRPSQLAQNSSIGKVPIHLVPSVVSAVRSYSQVNRVTLKSHSNFGRDPLEGFDLLKEIRYERFYERFHSDKRIFTDVIQKVDKTLADAIYYFKSLTLQLHSQT